MHTDEPTRKNIQARILSTGSATALQAALREAAALLRVGEPVAFPTETVYGLGANALSSEAVDKIYKAKGRPASNPVIVHVPSAEEARGLVLEWPEEAKLLSQAFWPGPLTLVLPKSHHVPEIVTAGGDTIAVRVPDHPVALALLSECRLPLAAPSANLSCSLSPTSAQHVFESLGDRIQLIIDGGPCSGGIESTVVAVREGEIQVLRPGLITRAQIEQVLGKPVSGYDHPCAGALPSPGLMVRHYCPRARLVVTDDSGADLVRQITASGGRVGWMPRTCEVPQSGALVILPMPASPLEYAAELYQALHQMDAVGVETIVCEAPPADAAWEAIRDRLSRASS